MERRTIHKRVWLAAVVLLATLAPSPALAVDEVSLRLHWLISGVSTGWYLGIERGYFAEEGIRLSVYEGKGSVIAAQVVASKGDTFGSSDAASVIQTAAKGAPIKTIVSLQNAAAWAVISLKHSGIKTLRDLEGKKLALTPGDALTQQWPIVARVNKLETQKIGLAYTDPAAKLAALMEKKVDAMLGSFADQGVLLRVRGFDPQWLAFADHGVNTVGISVIAHEDTIKQKPDLVRRFVRAAVRTYTEFRKNPEAAAEATLKARPALNRPLVLEQARVASTLMDSANTWGKSTGWGAIEDWERTVGVLKEAGLLTSDRPASSYFTNEFIPQ